MTRYRTIVADPPWHYDGFPGTEATGRDKRLTRGKSFTRPMPYPSMTVEEISQLPIPSLADDDARLFLWTTNRYLPDSVRGSRVLGLQVPADVAVGQAGRPALRRERGPQLR